VPQQQRQQQPQQQQQQQAVPAPSVQLPKPKEVDRIPKVNLFDAIGGAPSPRTAATPKRAPPLSAFLEAAEVDEQVAEGEHEHGADDDGLDDEPALQAQSSVHSHEAEAEVDEEDADEEDLLEAEAVEDGVPFVTENPQGRKEVLLGRLMEDAEDSLLGTALRSARKPKPTSEPKPTSS
jgi:hypothetical protein